MWTFGLWLELARSSPTGDTKERLGWPLHANLRLEMDLEQVSQCLLGAAVKSKQPGRARLWLKGG